MVSEAMLPRAAVREVEQRLTAAGCPDADLTRGSCSGWRQAGTFAFLTVHWTPPKRQSSKNLPFAVRPGSRCNISAAAGLSST